MTAYYNEIDPKAAAALRLLAAENIIAPGHVDERSIKEVTADDLRGFTQCHFFAGAGLWSVAARLAGWPDQRPIWTASCPCQPFSNAGLRAGEDDPRHLWPDLLRVLRGARAAGHGPPVIVGEQVSGAAGYGWFDGVRADLEAESYAGRARDVPACSVDAPHERNRLWWVAVANAEGGGRRAGLREAGAERHGTIAADGDVGDELLADGEGLRGRRDIAQRGPQGRAADGVAHEGGREGNVVDTARERRGEGSTEAGVLRRRPAASGADLRERGDGDVGDTVGARLQGLDGNVDAGRAAGRRSDRDSRAGEASPACRSTTEADERGRSVGDAYGRRGCERTAQDHAKVRTESGPARRNGSWWADAEWIVCHDGKARRTKPGLRLLVDGMVGRIDLWRLAGNSIVPVLAAEVIASLLDAEAMMREQPAVTLCNT